MYGVARALDQAIEALNGVIADAVGVGSVPLWWIAVMSRHLLLDLWRDSLHVQLPPGGLPGRWSDLRAGFVKVLASRRRPQIDLWPSQLEAAARALDPRDDLLIALPTSAGKTRIAELCMLRALADDRRVIYVTPLRALSAQVERTLAQTFVPLGVTVTSLYGASGVTTTDVRTLADADVVVATPEKLDFAIRQDPDVLSSVGLIVFDEGHMIGLGSREIRYEALIQRLLRRSDAADRRLVCLSAMFDPSDASIADFSQWLRADQPGEPIHVRWRPTRQLIATLDWSNSGTGKLNFIEGEQPFVPRFVELQAPRKPRRSEFPREDKEFCIAAANAFARDGNNVLVYCPQRTSVEPIVREFIKIRRQGYLDGLVAPPADQLTVAMAIGREWLGEDHPILEALQFGVGAHHGALPRPFLTCVEELLLRRYLPIVVASPTLAQGIDLACRVLLFRSIHRFDADAGKQVPIPAMEFANVLGRAGRAYVDVDGIAVYPVFATGSRGDYQRAEFSDLVKKSRSQRLYSGFARLVWEIGEALRIKLGVPPGKFYEYVLNQRDLWQDPRIAVNETGSNQEDESGKVSLERQVDDLDIAILSLVDRLDASEDELPEVLDEVLMGSLWERTLKRVDEKERVLVWALLRSRADWLWRNSSPDERRACFYSGLGYKSGAFLFDRLDALVGMLVTAQQAVNRRDAKRLSDSIIQFATEAFETSFFRPLKLPDDWPEQLAAWVRGDAFAQIAGLPGAHEFIQDGVVFKLVWAAEAVRVQASSIGHAQADELGDGPALCLTHGVPSVAAALLCQMGFTSRVGATWLGSVMPHSLTDPAAVREWLHENESLTSDLDFWNSPDEHLLWRVRQSPSAEAAPTRWETSKQVLKVNWLGARPAQGTSIRIVSQPGTRVHVCSSDLETLGFAPSSAFTRDAFLEGVVGRDATVIVSRFGPNSRV
jgi:hypothetical protein